MEGQKCKVCIIKDGKYKCPKCSIFYCSVKCYQSHNLECTESFYEKCVNEELSSRKATPEETKKMKTVLSQMNSKDNEEEEKEIPKNIIKRLKHLNNLIEEGKMTIDILTPKEQEEMIKYLGKITSFSGDLPEWIPWWDTPIPNLDIEEVESTAQTIEPENNTNLNEMLDYDEYEEMNKPDEQESWEPIKCTSGRFKVVKQRYKVLPEFSKLINGKPVNPIVRYHIINILYPFIFFSRLYNGDLNDDTEKVVNSCWNCSDAFSGTTTQANICSAKIAASMAQEKLAKKEKNLVLIYRCKIMKDIEQIWKSKALLLEGLFRMYDLVHKVEESSENSKMKNKLIFLLAYIKTMYPNVSEILPEIESVSKEYEKELINAEQINEIKKHENIIIQ